jgi:thiol-disulfide isomerase/thioredoxin
MGSNRWIIVLVTLFVVHTSRSQTYHLSLDTLTTLSDLNAHVEPFTPTPVKPVKLPPTDLTGERFAKVFYSWDVSDDPDVVIMVRSTHGGDMLYIDRNANNDLTDDGAPAFFPVGQDTLTFDLVSRTDPRQRVKLLFSRALRYHRAFQEMPDSSKARFIDRNGTLNPRFARFWSAFAGGQEFTGERGTFFFDDRVTLRRATFEVNGRPHAIGLFDWTNNGLYNDRRDALLVDVPGNGVLSCDSPDVFTLDDVFSIDSLNFRIRALDPYGSWIDLERTSANTTHHFADHMDSLALASTRTFQIDQRIWALTATGLDSNMLPLSSLRGTFLFLNFWGEWCGPCLREIPALLHAAARYPDSTRVRFLGFVDARDIQKARKVIAESGMHWQQLFLDKKARDVFPVHAFPTNMLILPNGQECIVTQTVSDAFFDKYVR